MLLILGKRTYLPMNSLWNHNVVQEEEKRERERETDHSGTYHFYLPYLVASTSLLLLVFVQNGRFCRNFLNCISRTYRLTPGRINLSRLINRAVTGEAIRSPTGAKGNPTVN